MPHRTLTSLTLALLLAGIATACDDAKKAETAETAETGPKYQPVLTTDLVAPALKGLVLGVATERDVVAAFGAGDTIKDKSLGGTASVKYNEAAGVHIDVPASGDVIKGEAWLVPDKGGELRLHRLDLTLKATDTCAWIGANVAKHDATKRRPGSNRKFGAEGSALSLTAGTTDGATAVGIECSSTTKDGKPQEWIAYSIESEKGRSMSMNREP